MKLNKSGIFLVLSLLAGIYLFVSAPPPLEMKEKVSANIPIQVALKIVDDEHARVRKLYTKEIVGAGMKQGFKFLENWQEEDVIAGPLPAQFLREISRSLEQSSVPLGLYLASDYAINKSNELEGEQLKFFKEMKKNNQPVFTYVNDIQRFIYMVPDVAVAKPCVQCHNEHKESPKNDWQEGDIMGATTWTYPEKTISYEELFSMINSLHKGIGDAYSRILEEFGKLPKSPVISKQWPAEGYAIPDMETFMTKVSNINSIATLKAIAGLSQKISSPVMVNND